MATSSPSQPKPSWLHSKVVAPFTAYIKQGAEPLILARSAAFGWTMGCCPLLGVSAGFSLLVVWVTCGFFHLPMTILANFCALPVEVILIVPFMRLGEVLMRAPHLDIAPMNVLDVIYNAPTEALRSMGHALLGWAVVLPPAAALLTLVLYPCFELARKRIAMCSADRALVDMHAVSGADQCNEGTHRLIPSNSSMCVVSKA